MAEYVFGDYVMWVGFICVDLLVSVGDASEEDVGTSYRFVIREFHFNGGRQAGPHPMRIDRRDRCDTWSIHVAQRSNEPTAIVSVSGLVSDDQRLVGRETRE